MGFMVACSAGNGGAFSMETKAEVIFEDAHFANNTARARTNQGTAHAGTASSLSLISA
jgi:hypothetical protein